MKLKKSIIIIFLLIGFICIGIVSANENITAEHNEIHSIAENNIDNIAEQSDQEIINADSPKELQINIKPQTFEKSKDINYVVKVDNYKTDFPGEKIWLTLDVVYPNGFKTDAGLSYINNDGYTIFSLTGFNLDVGRYNLTVRPYDENYKAINPTSYIEVKNPVTPQEPILPEEPGDVYVDPTPTIKSTSNTVKAPSITVPYQANKYFKVTVKNSKNKPIKNLKLKIKVYTGNSYKTYTVKTNNKGIASLSTKNLKTGIHKVVITSGNSKYKISKSSKITVQPVKFKIGKYTGTFTLSQINSIKKAKTTGHPKTVTVKTGKYVKGKYPVKMSLSSHGVDGSNPGNNKAFLEVWSSYGPISVKKITIY